jgi:hypothetical protein
VREAVCSWLIIAIRRTPVASRYLFDRFRELFSS